MAKHKITLLPGDGIGPEVTAAVVSIIECAGVEVEWEKYFVGAEAISRFGDPLPQGERRSMRRRYFETLLQRSIKILGTFSKQPLTRGRMWYLDFIPPTLESVRRCLDELPEYGALAALIPMHFEVVEARARAERMFHGQAQDHAPAR